ncbi:cupin domain-containing protein [Geomesophilobacter sediminis]|uniref:Cupin domain-containing protein n=1 Tax=Geomesophilobacter sediminis TaxID=2798584 RepID=A0A8J7SAU3_9BACT|nr:cupin domain-containing protein [Geomesophilobacter sediminis]MBJ6727675.1 cupin domain-containing protein [Geomesophilobacter sediminis]
MENVSSHLDELPWVPVRPGVATGVFGKTLLDGATKIVLTRVEPDGGFATHVDRYGHLMQVLEGEGVATVGAQEYAMSPGIVLRIPAGLPHSYRNCGAGYLVLLSVNLPV